MYPYPYVNFIAKGKLLGVNRNRTGGRIWRGAKLWDCCAAMPRAETAAYAGSRDSGCTHGLGLYYTCIYA